MKQENFLYFGRRPTNVCYNGTSFPIEPGDVVCCYKEFWESFVPDERLYKIVPDDFKTKPKYKFGRSPVFVKRDPTGGLPVTSSSTPGANPRLKDKMPKPRRDPDLISDENFVNPYDLGVDEVPTIDISTSPNLPSAPEPKADDISTSLEGPAFVGAEIEEEIEDFDTDEVEADVEIEAEEIIEEQLLARSALRKLTRDEVFAECKRLAETGCPGDEEKLEAFEGYDDGTTRGVMFKELWDYCGYNN